MSHNSNTEQKGVGEYQEMLHEKRTSTSRIIYCQN